MTQCKSQRFTLSTSLSCGLHRLELHTPLLGLLFRLRSAELQPKVLSVLQLALTLLSPSDFVHRTPVHHGRKLILTDHLLDFHKTRSLF